MKLFNSFLSVRKILKSISLKRAESGISLAEILIALALLSIIGVGFLSGLGTASKSLYTTDELETAKNLAQSQMEYIKAQPFDNSSYTPAPIPSEYAGAGYTVDNPIVPVLLPSREDDSICGIQKIKIIVRHNAKAIIMAGDSTLESFKVER